MAMPDFSFLQNQPGNTSFGDLAKGLAQGAQLGMNMQNMKLQQAAQQQELEMKKQSFQLEQTKYLEAQIANQKKQEYMAGLRSKADQIADPLERARFLALGFGPVDPEAAKQMSDVYKNLSVEREPGAYKPNQVVEWDITLPSGEPGKAVGTWKGKDFKYEGPNKEFAKEGFGEITVAKKAESFDRLAKLTPIIAKDQSDVRAEYDKYLKLEDKLGSMYLNQQDMAAIPAGFKGIATFMARMADAAGVPLSGAEKWTADDAGATAAAADLMTLFGGSDTEKEFGWARDTLPTLLQDEAGRIKVMDSLMKHNNRNKERAMLKDDWLRNEQMGTKQESQLRVLDRYNKEHPLRAVESPLKAMRIQQAGLSPNAFDPAEAILRDSMKAAKTKPEKEKLVSQFIKQYKYVPAGY